MLYKYKKSAPRWISFENATGAKGEGGKANNGAKGHACESLSIGEEKTLCNLSGSGVVRRIWMTLSDRSQRVLQGIILKAWWDDSDKPQVECPLGDFFCMSTGVMTAFENCCFSTAEGRSFCCFIPMPFKKSCKIALENKSGTSVSNLFYDVDLTLEEVTDEDMYFYARFCDVERNEGEKEVKILPRVYGSGRFLGCSVGIFPDEESYGDIWWGEGEVKIYIDGDENYPTLCGTGTEDYIGSAWELGRFINRTTGCTSKESSAASFYRFHVDDEIYFERDIEVTIQAMGGGAAEKVRAAMDKGAFVVPVSSDGTGCFYKSGKSDFSGYVNFFRRDHYRIAAYYYKKA